MTDVEVAELECKWARVVIWNVVIGFLVGLLMGIYIGVFSAH